MRILLRTLLESLRAAESGRVSAIWQGILHVAAIYFIARLFVPWLLEGAHGELILFLLGHPSGGNPLQFFFSHLLALSVLPGFIAGLVNATFLRNRVAC